MQYAQRIDISVSIICMVNHTALISKNSFELLNITNASFIHHSNHKQYKDILNCPKKEFSGLIDGEFVWPKQIQVSIVMKIFINNYLRVHIKISKLRVKFLHPIFMDTLLVM